MSAQGLLSVSAAPHIKGRSSIPRTMYTVVLALLFPTGAAIYFFGFNAIKVIATSIASTIVTDYLMKKLRGRAFALDGSTVITGLLLALILPPTTPLWMVAVGAFFAIAIAREAFGGLGQNIFNPALAGRAFMQLAFPLAMSTWVMPQGFKPDAVTSATPLGGVTAEPAMLDLFFGKTAGSLGETSVLAILLGGALLIALRIIDWRIPLAYIGTVAVFSLALGEDPLFQILSGGLMLGAFFLATDYVTSPITCWGRVIFGVGAGILTVIIRLYGSLPEGVCFSILIMNALVPVIDSCVKPRPYGLKRAKEAG